MYNPLDAFIPQAEQLLDAVKAAHASGRLGDAASEEFAQINAKLAELKSALEKTDKEMDAAIEKARADQVASANQIAEKKAARAAAKAAPKPALPTFGNHRSYLDDARILAAIESLCGKRDPSTPTVPQREIDGDVAALHTGEWSGEGASSGFAGKKPPPHAPVKESPPAHAPTPTPAPRTPQKPKVGKDSFEWESTNEWDQKGI